MRTPAAALEPHAEESKKNIRHALHDQSHHCRRDAADECGWRRRKTKRRRRGIQRETGDGIYFDRMWPWPVFDSLHYHHQVLHHPKTHAREKV